MREFRARRAFFVSPSGFTQPARDLAHKHKIYLVESLEQLSTIAKGRPHYSKIELAVRGGTASIIAGVVVLYMLVLIQQPQVSAEWFGLRLIVLFGMFMAAVLVLNFPK